jgi:hypothetical protein
MVTAYLFAALDDLRDEIRPLRLWADAICSDQSNNLERSLQVGLVRQIYSIAQRTVVYLGKSEEYQDYFAELQGEQSARIYTDDIFVGPYWAPEMLSSPWFTRV